MLSSYDMQRIEELSFLAHQHSWTGRWVPTHVAQYTAPQCLLSSTLCLSQQGLEEAAPLMEGAEVCRARIQWKKKMFMSFADTKHPLFLKICIYSGLHAIGSNFLAKLLLSFDHGSLLFPSASNDTVFLNAFSLYPLIFFSIPTGKWWAVSKMCHNSEKIKQLLYMEDMECHISKGGHRRISGIRFHIDFLKDLGKAVISLYFSMKNGVPRPSHLARSLLCHHWGDSHCRKGILPFVSLHYLDKRSKRAV